MGTTKGTAPKRAGDFYKREYWEIEELTRGDPATATALFVGGEGTTETTEASRRAWSNPATGHHAYVRRKDGSPTPSY